MKESSASRLYGCAGVCCLLQPSYTLYALILIYVPSDGDVCVRFEENERPPSLSYVSDDYGLDVLCFIPLQRSYGRARFGLISF